MSSEVRIHLGEELTEAVMALVPKDADEALLLDEPDLDYSLWKVVDLPCFAASLNISEASLDPSAPFEWRPASVIYLSRCVCDDVHHGGVQETYLVAGGICAAQCQGINAGAGRQCQHHQPDQQKSTG